MNNLRKDLRVLETLGIKPNYTQLAKIHGCDPRTVKKYNEGYEGKAKTRNKTSCLDKYIDEITEKINLPGATVYGTYKYFLDIDKNIKSYQNFNSFVNRKKLKITKDSKAIHPRFETPFGEQLQFDWKENIKMISKNGTQFEFNVFSATLSASRLHVFLYSKTKLREDVERCLIDTFKYICGVPKHILTDNMSSIVNTSSKKFVTEFTHFCKDMGTISKNCKVRSPQTKGKVESSNRFMSWLIPYNHEFETEQDIINILDKITKQVNIKVNDSIGTSPLMLYNKEKEYLLPLPSNDILDSYVNDTKTTTVSNGFLVYFRGNQYSVPPKFINKKVQLKELDNKLYIYYTKDLIALHDICDKKINYDKTHYIEGFNSILKDNEDAEKKALDNLRIMDSFST